MRVLFLFLALAASATFVNAQSTPLPLPDVSNIEEFSARPGRVIQREFTRMGDFSGGRVDSVTVSDLTTKTSIQGLMISGRVGADASRRIAYIDADEIGSLAKAIDLIRASAFATTPDNITDLAFRTRGGFSVGAVYADKHWTASVRLDRYDPRTAIYLDESQMDTLRTLLTKARESIR